MCRTGERFVRLIPQGDSGARGEQMGGNSASDTFGGTRDNRTTLMEI